MAMKKSLILAVISGLVIIAGMPIAKPAPPAMARCSRIHAAVVALDNAIAELNEARA
jgi:hypothetical protein